MFWRCGTDQQSPIDIQSADAVPTVYPNLTFNNYGSIELTSILDNGHTGSHFFIVGRNQNFFPSLHLLFLYLKWSYSYPSIIR